jgi:hypothetical protein
MRRDVAPGILLADVGGENREAPRWWLVAETVSAGLG